MISITVQRGWDGQMFSIDTEDDVVAANWLLAIALEHGPDAPAPGIYPMTITKCRRWLSGKP